MSLELVLKSGRKARKGARRFHVVTSLFLVACVGSVSFSAVARDEPRPAYEIKSAFLYNFAKFIQWPSKKFGTPESPIIVGVIGGNPFGNYLTELDDKPIGRHHIKIEIYSSAAQARRCHILFIKDTRARVAKIIADLQNEDVLTVTDEVDEDSFKSVGAVVNLVTTANKTVRFQINVDAARRAELQINSSLLNLAKIVRDGKA